jgi:hypothetical protein
MCGRLGMMISFDFDDHSADTADEQCCPNELRCDFKDTAIEKALGQ